MKAIDYYAGVTIPDLGDKALDVAVIGSGSFGTAMANLIVHNGHRVTLYGRNKAALDAMKETRINSRYLPDAVLSDRLNYTNDIGEAVRGKSIVVFAVPAQTFRQVSADASKYLEAGTIVVNLAKGIEKNTLKRMSEVAEETIPQVRYVALSGPTHAEEIVMNAPAGIVAASVDPEAAKFVQDAFMSEQLRIYTQDDMVGVEIAGAVKNVIAIATGISDGMKLGSNARAALMTRSVHEIKRLGLRLGANAETFSGLAGIGDLIVTCATDLSRNRRCGLLIGDGLKAEEAVEKVGSVVEGYYTADAVYDLAGKLGVEMPVCMATRAVLKGEIAPVKQDESKASKVGLLTKTMGELDFNRTATELERLIRGLDPWPGAYTFAAGKKLSVWKADAVEGNGEPGVIKDADRDHIDIGCREGILRVTELQAEGRKRMSAGDFLNGSSLKAGDMLGRA